MINSKSIKGNKKYLILITGLPASGKTTIAKRLANEFGLHYIACVIDGGRLVGCGEAKKTLTLDVIRKIYGDSFGISNNEYIEIKI